MTDSGNRKLKIGFVVGTRPEAIKLAPVIQMIKRPESRFDATVISTGQHKEMLDQVFEIFNIVPDVKLEIMKSNQGLEHITAEAVGRLPAIFSELGLDLIFVQGDTSTAFAAALGSFYRKIKVGHIEAGLRTFDKHHPFPEEINRRLIGQLADYHFAPTSRNKEFLLREGIPAESIFITGNTVVDALFETVNKDYEIDIPEIQRVIDSGKRIVLVTAHRRENFGQPLEDICKAILKLTVEFDDVDVIYPVHLNPNVQKTVNELLGSNSRIHLIKPQDYKNFVMLLKHSYLILTDSGGVQEEAPSLGKPVLVLRETTERPEAVEAGSVKIVGTDCDTIFKSAALLLSNPEEYKLMARAINPYGDGRASVRIIEGLEFIFGLRKNPPQEFTI